MKIRVYREADRQAIKEITVEAFHGVSIDQAIEREFGVVGGHDWRWRKARHIDEDVDAEGAAIFVAEELPGEVIGYVTTRYDAEARVGFIPNLAVRAGQRGQGLGRQLIEHALEHFRHAGAEIVRIETLSQNVIGNHLYPDCGFVPVAQQIHLAMRLQSAAPGH
jgi:ribosomal protein S18 acetylase RimI-like enzyme